MIESGAVTFFVLGSYLARNDPPRVSPYMAMLVHVVASALTPSSHMGNSRSAVEPRMCRCFPSRMLRMEASMDGMALLPLPPRSRPTCEKATLRNRFTYSGKASIPSSMCHT